MDHNSTLTVLEKDSETSSTGLEDYICDNQFQEDMTLFSTPISPNWETPLELTYEGDDQNKLIICQMCRKNFNVFSTQSFGRRKRRRVDDGPVLSSMTICQQCSEIPLTQLNDMKDVSNKTKRIIRRQRAKQKFGESESLKKLIEQQQELLEKSMDLPEQDRKRVQQMIRNRISAQQSRDRKKAYVSELEAENEQLRNENSKLEYKLKILSEENNHLKQRLTQSTQEETVNYWGSSIPINMTFAFTTLFGIILLFQCFQVNFAQPVPQSALIPKYYYQSDFNARKLQELSSPPRLRTQIDDPCLKELRADLRYIESLTTMYCPTVQTTWSDDLNKDLKYLQLLLPIDQVYDDILEDDYMLEVMCRVTDANLVKNNAVG